MITVENRKLLPSASDVLVFWCCCKLSFLLYYSSTVTCIFRFTPVSFCGHVCFFQKISIVDDFFCFQQRFGVMPTTVGPMDPPLGNTRLQTSRLLASLLLTNTHSINVEIAKLGTINTLIVSVFYPICSCILDTL